MKLRRDRTTVLAHPSGLLTITVCRGRRGRIRYAVLESADHVHSLDVTHRIETWFIEVLTQCTTWEQVETLYYDLDD